MQKYKFTWHSIKRILPNDNDYMHPDIVAIRKSIGQKTRIPILLHHNDECVLRAEVSLYPASTPMEGAALFLLERKLRQNNLSVTWNRAIAGTARKELDAGRYLAHDSLAEKVMAFPDADLRDNLRLIAGFSETRQRTNSHPMSPYEKLSLMAAAIIVDSAVVKSTDMEIMLFKQDTTKPAAAIFKPADLEF